MKPTSLLASALLALGLVFLATGCATTSASRVAAFKGPPTYALIATVSGGTAPNDAQWATMQKRFSTLLAARGLILVTDPSKADKLIQVLFVPDLEDPALGVSYVVGVRDNAGALLAKTIRPITTGLGYATSASFSPFGSQLQYYGYFEDYSDNYGNSAPIASGGPASRPPGHDGDHHTTRPVDCPPDTPHHPPSGGYAGNPPSHSSPPNDGGGHWWNRAPRSDSDYSSSSSSSYSSGSSRSSSDFVGPTTSYSSSSSSSQSMSFPSSSSSSSYSPPAQISFPSSSSSSSSSDAGSSHSVPQAEKP